MGLGVPCGSEIYFWKTIELGGTECTESSHFFQQTMKMKWEFLFLSSFYWVWVVRKWKYLWVRWQPLDLDWWHGRISAAEKGKQAHAKKSDAIRVANGKGLAASLRISIVGPHSIPRLFLLLFFFFSHNLPRNKHELKESVNENGLIEKNMNIIICEFCYRIYIIWK